MSEFIGLWLACGLGGSALFAVVWTRCEGMDLTTDELPAFAFFAVLGPVWLLAAAGVAIGYGVKALWRKAVPKTSVLMRGRK